MIIVDDLFSFKQIGLIGDYDFMQLNSMDSIVFHRYYSRNMRGLEIFKPDVVLIQKPKYWCPDYIKNGKFYWYADIRMMRRICKKSKTN